MGWKSFTTGFSQDKAKRWYKKGRCPYALCPANQPFTGAHKSRLKFVQKISPMTYQYKCKDCGCLTNFCFQAEDISEKMTFNRNPALMGKKSSFTLWGR